MRTPMRDNKGQFLVEMVLMMTLSLGLFMWATKELRDKKVLAHLISGPWVKISGMLEAGTWDSPEAARKNHPNSGERILSYDPEGAG